jgi:PST family polysaccharide transporter
MINRLLQRKDIVFNTFHVFLNKGINAIVPVLLLPYFNKVFGVERFGELIYIQSLMILLMFITDYGFNVTGTRDVSINKGDKKYLSDAVSSIMSIKLILTTCCYSILLLYLDYQEFPMDTRLLYILTFTAFVLQSLTPYWFFQGIKSNWIITLVNLTTKILLLVLVFGFITEGSEMILVPVSEAISYALSFITSIVIIFFILKIRFSWPDWNLIRVQLKSGQHIFLFSIFNWMITGGAIVAVEWYLSSTDLGYFGTFSRLMYYAFALVQPINQALFPYVSEKASLPAGEGLRFIRGTFKIYGLLVVLFLLVVFALAGPLFSLFFDEKFTTGLEPFMPVFYLMSIWMAMVMVNYFIGLQVLVAFSKDKVYSKYYFINTIIAITGLVLLLPRIGLIGAPLSLIFGELILFIFLYSAYSGFKKEAT